MKFVVGLGNPGKKYAHTRHNAGFLLIDKLARSKHIKLTRHRRFYNGRINLAGESILLVKPLTYMNNSGEVVRQIVVDKLSLEDLLIIFDDFQLPLGKIRIRRKGSSGGHKGLESITQHLETDNFPRLRIGIGRPSVQDSVKYVLGNFTRQETSQISSVFDKAIEMIKSWVSQGIDECMNKFN